MTHGIMRPHATCVLAVFDILNVCFCGLHVDLLLFLTIDTQRTPCPCRCIILEIDKLCYGREQGNMETHQYKGHSGHAMPNG